MDCSKNVKEAVRKERLKVRQQQLKTRQEEIINLVMRQTDYDRVTILEKIKKWNGNYLYVIKEYMNPNFNPTKKKEKKFVSNNQKVFGEIRNFMDIANKNYERRKAIGEKKKELYAKYIKQIEMMKKAEVSNLETISENVKVDNIIIEGEDDDTPEIINI